MTDALILSNALDTNGQNARYVRASEKHGMSEGILDILAIGKVDPGGVVARFQEASANHPEVGLRIRSAHKADQYFRFPGDLRWGHDAPREQRVEVRQLAHHADVIHLNNSERALFELGMSKARKPALLHHHGTLFRSNPPRLLGIARQYRMTQAVSTVDLQRPAPQLLTWLPTAYDVAALEEFGRKHATAHDTIRIGHFPTNRALKNTEAFLAAVEALQKEDLPIELVMIERETNDVVMAAKATCDIVYDQVMFGYGCNAVEAWGMGIPVIAGADEWTTKRMKELWGGLPYEHATVGTLKAVIRRMVKSKDMRAEAAARGVAHVRRYHDELPALTILAELYHDTMRVRERVRIQGKGVTFQSARRKVMHVDDQPVDFTMGTVEVTDVKVIEGLRNKIRQRPAYGLREVRAGQDVQEEGVA